MIKGWLDEVTRKKI
jgi:hypothetical protein